MWFIGGMTRPYTDWHQSTALKVCGMAKLATLIVIWVLGFPHPILLTIGILLLWPGPLLPWQNIVSFCLRLDEDSREEFFESFYNDPGPEENRRRTEARERLRRELADKMEAAHPVPGNNMHYCLPLPPGSPPAPKDPRGDRFY